jgi:hypothetical protein
MHHFPGIMHKQFHLQVETSISLLLCQAINTQDLPAVAIKCSAEAEAVAADSISG